MKGGDAIFLDEPPEAIGLGPIRRALIHDHGRAGGQRPVDDVRVPGDPSDVGCTPENVLVLHVKDPLHGGEGLGQVATSRVDDALRLAGRARRVEHI